MLQVARMTKAIVYCLQLVRVLEIYWEVHTRHPHLADSAVSAAMGQLQRLSHTHSDKVDHTQCNGTAEEEDRPNEVICFVKNMLTVLERMDISLARQQNTRQASVDVSKFSIGRVATKIFLLHGLAVSASIYLFNVYINIYVYVCVYINKYYVRSYWYNYCVYTVWFMD